MAGKNLLNSVQMTRPRSNVFDLSHDFKFSANMGKLIPIMVEEVVPGDKWKIGCSSLIRLAPMVAPLMHRVDVTMHYFFVPNRLVWKDWEDYITNGGEYPGELPAYPVITMNTANWAHGLPDYMGIPEPIGAETEVVSAIPFAALAMVYDEYYRDQNLIPSIQGSLSGNTGREYLISGNNDPNAADLLTLRNRCWEHDYFTAALPFAQKGAAVNLPLGTVELRSDFVDNANAINENPHFKGFAGDVVSLEIYANQRVTNQAGIGAAGPSIGSDDNGDVQPPYFYDPAGSLEVGATTINDLRRAFRLQEWLEKAARGGSRYIELIRTMFGVMSSDKRLQRPEYITGIKSPIQISEVLNTTGTTELPQGNMAGHGVGFVSGKYGRYYAEEHGYIIGVMSVMPKTAYQQGIPRHFLKTSDPFQYYWEQFAHIGEQEIQNREIFAYQGSAAGSETFGYIPRYAEYKFANNRVAGEFRTTLNHWTMARIFATAPALNEDFVKADPTHRIFAVTDEGEDKLYCHVYNDVKAVRPMPVYGTPTY